jgi:hypothetical protein
MNLFGINFIAFETNLIEYLLILDKFIIFIQKK